ncbi:MAG: serine/threonine-protein kinase [Myxococcaceae bacterium]
MTTTSVSASIQTATLLGRLRGTPGLWVFALLVLLAPVVLWLEWRVVRAEASSPDLGIDVQRTANQEARVAFNDGRWVGVEQGDEIRSLEGQPITTQNFWLVRTSLHDGPVRMVFSHEGREFEVSSHTTPRKFSIVVAYSVRLLTAALLLLIALGAFLMRPGGAVSWLFLLFLYTVALVTMMTTGFINNGNALFLIIYSLLSSAPSIGLLLFTIFPRRLTVARWQQALIVAPSAALVLAHLVRTLFLPNVPSFPFEIATRVWSTLACLGLLLGQVWQLRQASKSGDARLASLYRLLVISTFAGLFAPVLFSSVARFLRLDGSFVMEVSATLVLLFAVLMGVVLVRHNPLAVDRYATSVVGYVLTVGGLGVVFVVGMLGLPLLAERTGLAQSSEGLVGITAAVTLSVGPVYRRLRRRVDRWFSEEQADVMQTSVVLRTVVDAVQREPQARALQIIIESLKVLGVEHASRWHLDPTGKELRRLQVLGTPSSTTNVLLRDEVANELLDHSAGVASLTPTAASAAAQQALWGLGLAFSAPIRAHGVAVGFLGVGRRGSGFAQRPEDEAFVGALAAQAGLALERGDQVTTIGRYRVERRLASGGMAEIFVAWQLGPGGFERKVALKRLLPELAEDPRHAASLLDEASITARLSHPNIARIFEVGLEGGQHFIAMEFVDGPPLRALLAVCRKHAEPPPLDVWLGIAQALLAALHHAHTVTDAQNRPLGVVHRDVTPANLLLTAGGDVKLVDFGLVFANARLFRTQTGVARGTMPYMSPEQAAGETNVDRRTDVYSAAATLYEALTLQRAFPEGPYGPRPSPASVARDTVPKALDAVLEKALSLNAAERFESAEALWLELLAAAAVAPASSAAIGAWVQARQGEVSEQPQRPQSLSASDETRSVAVNPKTVSHVEPPTVSH